MDLCDPNAAAGGRKANIMLGKAPVSQSTVLRIYAKIQGGGRKLNNEDYLWATYKKAYSGYYRSPVSSQVDEVQLHELMRVLAMVPELGCKRPFLEVPIIVATLRESNAGVVPADKLQEMQMRTLRSAVCVMAQRSLGMDTARALLGGRCCSSDSEHYGDVGHNVCAKAAYLGMRAMQATTVVNCGVTPCAWPLALVARLVHERYSDRIEKVTLPGADDGWRTLVDSGSGPDADDRPSDRAMAEALDASVISYVSADIRDEIRTREAVAWSDSGLLPPLMDDGVASLIPVPAQAQGLGVELAKQGVLTLLAFSRATKRCLGISLSPRDGSVVRSVYVDPRCTRSRGDGGAPSAWGRAKRRERKLHEDQYGENQITLGGVLAAHSTSIGTTWILYDVHRRIGG